jgi:glutathione S-transferase
MKLYDFPLAPGPRRVRFFMAEKGLDIPKVTIDLMKKEQLTESFKQIYPEQMIPALELDDGTIVGESVAICYYLENLYPEPPLLGQNPKEKALIMMWNLRMENNGFNAAIEAFRNEAERMVHRALPGPHNYEQIPALALRGRLRVQNFLNDLEKHLSHSDYIAGDKFSIADITAVIAIDFILNRLAIEINSYNSVLSWHRKISERPAAKA